MRITFDNRSTKRTIARPLGLRATRCTSSSARRRPFLTATRLLSNQTFRDLYRTGTLNPDQRLKITNLTILFTDLQGSTALYDRVGDLVAFDLVRDHFAALLDDHRRRGRRRGQDDRRRRDGDFLHAGPSDARGGADARGDARAQRSADGEDLALNIGLHEGPCLAVMLDERQDYFGQTVNVASRVQGLADPTAILATGARRRERQCRAILDRGLHRDGAQFALRGVSEAVTVYEIKQGAPLEQAPAPG